MTETESTITIGAGSPVEPKAEPKTEPKAVSPDQLDESRPFGSVFGAGMVKYVQDGREFGANKKALLKSKPDSEKTLEDLPWQQLKEMLKQRGRRYVNRAQAIAELSELRKEEEAAEE